MQDRPWSGPRNASRRAAANAASTRGWAASNGIEVVLDGGALVDWLRNQNYAVPLLRAAPERIDVTSVRRLTAIAVADVAGYSRLMGADEEGPRCRTGKPGRIRLSQ